MPAPALFRHLRPIVVSLAMRPLLLAPVAVMGAVAWGFGSDYGAPAQFWHERLLPQFIAGLGTSLLFAQVCLVAFLLDSDSPNQPTSDLLAALRFHIRRSWWPLLAVMALLALWDPSNGWTFVLGRRWVFLVGLLLPVVVARVVVSFRVHPRRIYVPVAPPTSLSLPFEIALHLPIALAGMLTVLFTPNFYLEWICLELSLWFSLHGALLFVCRYREMRDPTERGVHLLAGYSFGLFFLIYQSLFLLTWLGGAEAALLYAPPVLVVEVLFALIVTVHGFLAYHFRLWYALVVALLVVLIALFNRPPHADDRPHYKLHFPELDYQTPVPLLQADFEGQYAQLLRRHAVLKEATAPSSTQATSSTLSTDPLEAVEQGYQRLVDHLTALQYRVLTRQRILGKPTDDFRLTTFSAKGLRALLMEKNFAQAEREYATCRKNYARLGSLLAEMETRALDQWRSRASAPKGPLPKLVIVAVSGGANRSALWTAHVLDTLEQEFSTQNTPFARNVRLISGASGGMVGAAYWAATLKDGRHQHTPADRDAFLDPVAADSLTPLVRHAVFLDLPTVVLPGEFTRDRGGELERSWGRHMDGALDVPLSNLAIDEWRGLRPSLVFSPMLVEDGRRLLISNLSLPFLTESAGEMLDEDSSVKINPGPKTESKHRLRPRPPAKPFLHDGLQSRRYSLSAVEFAQLFPSARQFRLSTAARMSATFPYFSPAVDLPTVPRRRVVDAGYYDNYGVSVAANFIYHHRDWLWENTSGVVLVQLRDSSSVDKRLFPDRQEPFWDYSRSVEWLTGPLVGAGSGREAGMSFRNDELVMGLSDYFNQGAGNFFTTVVFESEEDIAVSWYLSSDEIKGMKKGFEESSPNRVKLNRLKKWWHEDHNP